MIARIAIIIGFGIGAALFAANARAAETTPNVTEVAAVAINVTDLVIDPTNPAIAYASASYALYKSADGGTTWSQLNQDFGQTAIQDVALDPANPATKFLRRSNIGFFRSAPDQRRGIHVQLP